jgi:glutamate-1-semialdehyde aminotransferase
MPRSYLKSSTLFERAKKVMPGGIHLSGRPLTRPSSSPMYMECGEGARIRDVDGNEYIDYLMAFGPFLLGYSNEEVDRAAWTQMRQGHLLTMNHPLHVQFIETLLQRFPSMDMGVFLRTGSEATTAALRIARRATGRRRIARCGYHGWHDWCVPTESYVPRGLAEQVLEFTANDPSTLEALFDAYPGDIAAVILAPEMVLPHDPEVFHRIATLVGARGAVFVMDEVKTGVRITPGSVSQRIGLDPDIITLSKALGNGWPVAAVLGKRSIMEHGAGMHLSATFHGDTAAICAALKTLEIADRIDAPAHVDRLGTKLIDGLNQLVRHHALPAHAFGEPLPPMPMFKFTHPVPEANAALTSTFCEALLERGVLLHPRHMGFISTAHGDADIELTLEAAEEALTVVRRGFDALVAG